MPKKLYIAVLFFTVCSILAFGQAKAKPRLGILPFVGGTRNDGETIAALFSNELEKQNVFTIIPRTSAVNALVAEQNFQLSGYTDSDTIARLGRMLNADYVVSGHIRRLGIRNFIIATIVNVETFEQLAGDYREYRSIEEIPDILPAITERLIASIERDTSRLPKLAVIPFNIAREGVDVQAAEVLAQILAIEITNSGVYAVLPRTSTLQAVVSELEFQMDGYTADEERTVLGRAINAEYVLSAEVRSLGGTNMFIAQILHVEDGSLYAGDRRDYRSVEDGIILMPELAVLLTDRAGAAGRLARASRERTRTAMLEDPTRLWSIGATVGTSLTDPWLIGTLRGTVAPWRYLFFDIGVDVGFISKIERASYISLYPYLHFNYFRPIIRQIAGYAGLGCGFLYADYRIYDLVMTKTNFAIDIGLGFIFFNFLDVSYTLRTDFGSASNKIAIGYVKRF